MEHLDNGDTCPMSRTGQDTHRRGKETASQHQTRSQRLHRQVPRRLLRRLQEGSVGGYASVREPAFQTPGLDSQSHSEGCPRIRGWHGLGDDAEDPFALPFAQEPRETDDHSSG